ncbi:MAG: ATP-dependent helicase [Myxococcaceae bacterium]|nr:ATP-dependent helicase [Myxococcaceae bacterium]MBH2006046.1 ATP-dependent helicase [Myxococcaceae bacterium]
MIPELNAEQEAVVRAPMISLLVSAGAGSGKTRTLVCRVAHLIQQGIEPGQIILLTFTNKSARQMLSRVEEICGPVARGVIGGTFHSVALAFLRQENPEIRLISRDEAKNILFRLVKNSSASSLDKVFEEISFALNTRTPIPSGLTELYGSFLEAKRNAGVVDFDDLLLNFGKFATEGRVRSKALLVDEYQDINRLQGALIDALASTHRNLMVVGDDSQSIYAFRGADTGNMRRFKATYPEASHLSLSTNYRSSQEIVCLANAALKRFPLALQKKLIPNRGSMAKPALVPCQSSFQQALFVGQRIEELIRSGVLPGDIAVLYRAHRHSQEVKNILSKQRIHFEELLPNRDWSLEGQESERSQKAVTLASIHQAKGLEWKHVFVIWLVEGHFPSFMSYREPHGVEEERRLFYVALTRAMDSLTFCYPQERALRRSRFLEESVHLCDLWSIAS